VETIEIVTFCLHMRLEHNWVRYSRENTVQVPPTETPEFMRLLQRSGVALSRAEHGRHHQSPYAAHYCILGGWLNPLLDRFGFWRLAERLVYEKWGEEPNSWKDPKGGEAVRARALGYPPDSYDIKKC